MKVQALPPFRAPAFRAAPSALAPESPDGLDSGLEERIRRIHLGSELMRRFVTGHLDLLPTNVSGVDDGADALSNIRDTAGGLSAQRSAYGNAPGGEVDLTFSLLEGLKELSDDYSFRVTALAGGSHSSRSRHYLGVAMDVDTINGRRVNIDNPDFREFMAKAREMGATEVLGPGDRGHDTHLHIAWPRDAE